MPVISITSNQKLEAAFKAFASQADGSMSLEDVICGVRYLTGQRLSAVIKLDVEKILEKKGGIGMIDFSQIVRRIEETSKKLELEDLWEEMTGDVDACVKERQIIDWVIEAMGDTGKARSLAGVLWDELDQDRVGIVGLKEIKGLLQNE